MAYKDDGRACAFDDIAEEHEDASHPGDAAQVRAFWEECLEGVDDNELGLCLRDHLHQLVFIDRHVVLKLSAVGESASISTGSNKALQ